MPATTLATISPPAEKRRPVVALPLYPRLLGRAFAELAEPVRALLFTTSVMRARGFFRVRRGGGLLARLLCWALRMPPPGDGVPVRILVSPWGGGEVWERSFGGVPVLTEQRDLRPGLLAERLGPFEVRARAAIQGGALHLRPAGAALRIGRVGLPLPRLLAPQLSVELSSPEGDGRVHVRVSARMPLSGPLFSYEGFLGSEPG